MNSLQEVGWREPVLESIGSVPLQTILMKRKAVVIATTGTVIILIVDNIKNITTTQLPEKANLSWASFPCQDLSLAGTGDGLSGSRSSTFWSYWQLMKTLNHENRAPKLIVLGNVVGAVTSHNGNDFRTIIKALNAEGYIAGAMVIDAVLFLPQSRPRLFIVGVKNDINIPEQFVSTKPNCFWHTKSIISIVNTFSIMEQKQWCWCSFRCRSPEF